MDFAGFGTSFYSGLCLALHDYYCHFYYIYISFWLELIPQRRVVSHSDPSSPLLSITSMFSLIGETSCLAVSCLPNAHSVVLDSRFYRQHQKPLDIV